LALFAGAPDRKLRVPTSAPDRSIHRRLLLARAKLIVEVDGDSHGTQEEYDQNRTRWLEQQRGLRVVRFTNHDVHSRLDAVLESVRGNLLVAPPP
jgi:very-short-patch-repair endonuclease